jgi:hypothetical protein
MPDKDTDATEQDYPDAYDLRDQLGDTWGEKVLVMYYEGEPAEYYAASPGRNHIREAWPDHFDEPVWMHVNEVGYRLDVDNPTVSWEIIDWEDAPVSAEWEVEYPS